MSKTNSTPHFTSQPQSQANNETLSNTLKCLATIGVGTLATVVAFRQGKLSGLAKGIEKGLIDGELKTLKRLKTLDIKDFKKVGTFEKGKAFIDGKGFSGQLIHKKGTMTYVNGSLESALLNNGTIKNYGNNSIRVHRKISTYENKFETLHLHKGENGNIYRDIDKSWEPSNWYRDIISSDGKIQRTLRTHKNISHPNFKNGKEQAIYKVIDRDTGKTLKIDYRLRPTTYHPGTYKEHLNINGKKITALYNKNREFQTAYSVQYNPKTGIFTKNYYKMKDGNLVPTNKFCQVDKQSKNYLSYTVNQNGQKENYHFDYSWVTQHFYDGSRCTNNVEEMQRLIKEKGLKFDM